jgi:hypothetical protein
MTPRQANRLGVFTYKEALAFTIFRLTLTKWVAAKSRVQNPKENLMIKTKIVSA